MAGTDEKPDLQDGAVAPSKASFIQRLHTNIDRQLRQSGPLIVFYLMLVLIVGILVALVGNAPILSRLSDTNFARGVITFIIVVGTLGLAFVMVYQSFFSTSASDDGFRRAREVFAGFMGVLGTIVGFYFGSAEKPSAALELSAVRITESRLATYVSGGVRPYKYFIRSSATEFPEIKGSSEDGWILEQLVKSPKPGSVVTVEVIDGKQNHGTGKYVVPAAPSTGAPMVSPSGSP